MPRALPWEINVRVSLARIKAEEGRSAAMAGHLREREIS